MDEALHTEPVYLKNILHTPSTTTTQSDEDEISSIAFEGIAAYSHSFLHEKLADVDVDGYLRQPPTKDNVEVVVIESYLIKDFKNFAAFSYISLDMRHEHISIFSSEDVLPITGKYVPLPFPSSILL